jgi:hypothetical protein
MVILSRLTRRFQARACERNEVMFPILRLPRHLTGEKADFDLCLIEPAPVFGRVVVRLFHPLLHAGLARRTPLAIYRWVPEQSLRSPCLGLTRLRITTYANAVIANSYFCVAEATAHDAR